MDPLMLLFLLIAGLTGADSVSSVGRVSVQRGGSVTIPCFYEDRYKTHVKYWCRENYSSDPCTPIVRSESLQKKDEVSIRDDPDRQVFIVTMNNLPAGDSGYYWCGVEISGGPDVGTWIQLSVTEGVSTLSTVSVQRGGSVNIPCPYDNIYKEQVKYWCRGSDWSSCTPIVRTDSPQKKDEVSIRNDPVKRVFNVTINNVKTVDSGDYWCGVEISRGSAVGTRVYLSVTEGVSTLGRVSVQIGGSVTIPCFYDNIYQQHVKHWCRASDWSSCTPIVHTKYSEISGEVSRDDPDHPVFTVTINNVKLGDSGTYWCGVEISRGSAVGTNVYLSVTKGVSTLNTVSVQIGGSVTIPCFYDKIYKQQVKYWCRGSDWSSCTSKVRTDSTRISGEVSIRDDPDQRVFTVTINNLTAVDSSYYWCGVEIGRGSAVGTRVYLSVTNGVSTLNTVSVQSGGSVTILCSYDNMYQQHVKYWCKGSDWSSCTPIVHSISPKKTGEMSISNDPTKLTMNNLTTGDSGSYWCGVEISRGLTAGTRVSLSVTEGVSTLSTVSVQSGGSVTILCSYDKIYKEQVKYWCSGSDWGSCTSKVHTDSTQISGEVSIRDDPDQRVFNVTMNNLTAGDFGYYWCGVEIGRGSAVGTQVYLSVTNGVSTLNTVSAKIGGSVTILCSYDNIYQQQVKYWCNGSDWSSCTPIIRTNSTNISGEVTIRDDPAQRVFNVTMNKLTTGDSGYYWCGVEISGGSAVGTQVYLSVTEGGINEKQRLFPYVGLGLLVLLLVIIIITWKVWDKHKKKMAMNQNPGSTELTLNPDHEYAVIDRTGIIKGDLAEQASEEPGADLTYSSILLTNPQVSSRCSSHHPVVTPASDVVYSSVALKHRE